MKLADRAQGENQKKPQGYGIANTTQVSFCRLKSHKINVIVDGPMDEQDINANAVRTRPLRVII